MSTYNVRDAFHLLRERGIARDKQDVRKWLNQGYIEADPPENRRIGWRIDAEALQKFIQRFEQGEFESLRQRRRLSSHLTSPGEQAPPVTDAEGPQLARVEEEVLTLRQQVRSLRRELNDLKKILGFPTLTPAEFRGEA